MLAVDLGVFLAFVCTHRAARHPVESLLALDRDIGPARSLQLDVERSYQSPISPLSPHVYSVCSSRF